VFFYSLQCFHFRFVLLQDRCVTTTVLDLRGVVEGVKKGCQTNPVCDPSRSGQCSSDGYDYVHCMKCDDVATVGSCSLGDAIQSLGHNCKLIA